MNRKPITLAEAVSLFLASSGRIQFTKAMLPGIPHPPRHFKHKARQRPARRSRSRGALLKRGHK